MLIVTKTAKTTGKPSRKAAKKVTRDDVLSIIADVAKINKETANGLQELRDIQKETANGLQELRESHKETEKALSEAIDDLRMSHKETEKTLRESIASTKKTLSEAIDDLRMSHKETEKTLRESIASTEKTLNKAIGGLSNTMGALIEHFMTVGLPQKFKPFGFTFNRIATVKWADGENSIYTEIDGLLENGTQAMVVEVKTTLRNEDIDDHVARMEKVRRYADIHEDRRDFLGAIAATIVDKSSREYALKKGFFVIEPSGEDVIVTKPASDPRVWRTRST